MRQPVSDSDESGKPEFQKIVDEFLLQPGLPFATVVTAEEIERIFRKHGGLFGENGIFSTPIVLWAFLGQVLRDRKEASCKSAVAGIISFCLQVGRTAPTSDTGDYCRARAKLSEPALRELSAEIASDAEQQVDAAWLWKGRHTKLIDGFTCTMPDTEKNQAEFPHPRTQKKGVGLPIARSVVILSLAIAIVMDVVLGRYKGKETGESALLRQMMSSLMAGDVVVFDRYYCSFMMIALMLNQRVDVCARLHHLRHVDFRKGHRLGKYDHLIVWTRPDRPAWMDKAQSQKESYQGTFYLSGFDGLPCGRREDSRSSFLAVVACQRLSPKGVPRARLCRSDLSSASVCTPLRDASSAKASGSDRRDVGQQTLGSFGTFSPIQSLRVSAA